MADNGTPTLLKEATGEFQSIPLVYGNGFQLGLSNADISLVVQLDNVPQMRVAISYTTAKTLTMKLAELMARLERVTSHTIMTSDEVALGIQNINDA